MNPIELLKEDHRKVERMFANFMSSDSEDKREDLFQSIHTELLAHAEAEERAFYPVLRDEAPEEVDRALQDHMAVKQMLLDMLDADFDDEEFETRFTQLMDDVQRHVTEEESPEGLMALAEERLSEEQLSHMSAEIERIKRDVEGEMAA